MAKAERAERLRLVREQLLSILTVLDDHQEHHVAALLAAALDTLERRIAEQR